MTPNCQPVIWCHVCPLSTGHLMSYMSTVHRFYDVMTVHRSYLWCYDCPQCAGHWLAGSAGVPWPVPARSDWPGTTTNLNIKPEKSHPAPGNVSINQCRTISLGLPHNLYWISSECSWNVYTDRILVTTLTFTAAQRAVTITIFLKILRDDSDENLICKEMGRMLTGADWSYEMCWGSWSGWRQ